MAEIKYNSDHTSLQSVSGVVHLTVLKSAKSIYGLSENNFCFKGSVDTIETVTFETDSKLELVSTYSFYTCNKLKTVDFSNCLYFTTIGKYAFSNCIALESVKFAEEGSLDLIDERAFLESGLKSIFIPKSVLHLNDNAFYRCPRLANAVLDPEIAMTQLKGRVFDSCPALKNFTIPKSVKDFSGEFLIRSKNIETIIVAEGNTNFVVENSILFKKGKTEIVYFPPKKGGSLSIPSGVTSIQTCAFYGTTLNSVDFGDTVQYIGTSGFASSSITALNLPSSIRFLEYRAFANCKGLTEITLPEGLEEIKGSCFAQCANLALVIIPKSLKKLGGGAFNECKQGIVIRFADGSPYIIDSHRLVTNKAGTEIVQSLSDEETVTIINSVTTIKASAFQDHTEITDILFNDKPELTVIEQNAFSGCTSLKAFTFPSSLLRIYDNAFYSTALVDIIFEPNLCQIHSACFKDCSNLKTLKFKDSKTSLVIHKQAFANCPLLNSVTLPAGLSSLGDSAFEFCSKIESISFPASITSIGANAFKSTGIKVADFRQLTLELSNCMFLDCHSLEQIIFPSSVSTIGEYCFSKTSITEVALPTSVTVIGEHAFDGCVKFEKLIIPAESALESINYGAFAGCTVFSTIENSCNNFELINTVLYDKNLTRVILMPPNSPTNYLAIPQTIETVTSCAFFQCRNLLIVFIPDNSVQKIDPYAFEDCVNIRVINLPKCVGTVGVDAFKGCKSLQCGLFIDNHTTDFLEQLTKAKLPPSCFKECIKVCTQKSQTSHHLLFTFAFLALIIE